jgi:hypothetical protein
LTIQLTTSITRDRLGGVLPQVGDVLARLAVVTTKGAPTVVSRTDLPSEPPTHVRHRHRHLMTSSALKTNHHVDAEVRRAPVAARGIS